MAKKPYKILIVSNDQKPELASPSEDMKNIRTQLMALGLSHDSFKLSGMFAVGETQENIDWLSSRMRENEIKYKEMAEAKIAVLRSAIADDPVVERVQKTQARIDAMTQCIENGTILSEEMGAALFGEYKQSAHHQGEKGEFQIAVTNARNTNRQLEEIKSAPTALGAIRQGIDTKEPIDAIVIVNHDYHEKKTSTIRMTNPDLKNLVSDLPKDMAVLYVGEADAALKAGIPEESILPRTPKLEYRLDGAYFQTQNGDLVSTADDGNENKSAIPPIELPQTDKPDESPPISGTGMSMQQFLRLLDGPPPHLEKEEVKYIAEELRPMIARRNLSIPSPSEGRLQ